MENHKKVFPLPVSISFLVLGLVLSVVDLAFLNDVIGQVLHMGSLASSLTSAAIGLVGMSIMAYSGAEKAHHDRNVTKLAITISIWLLMGFALAAVRLISATVMGLDDASGESLTQFMGMTLREVDFIFAPIMFLLYLATGILARDGVYNLLANPEFDRQLEKFKSMRAKKKLERDEARSKQLERQNRIKARRELEARKARERQKRIKALQEIKNSYYREERDFVGVLNKCYEEISAIEALNSTVESYLNSRDAMLRTIYNARTSMQSEVALKVHAKTRQDINKLNDIIDHYNSSGDVRGEWHRDA